MIIILGIIFITLAFVNIGIAFLRMIEDAENWSSYLPNIGGWVCSILYCILYLCNIE